MNSEKRNLYLLSSFIPACLFLVLFTPSTVCRILSAVVLAVATAVVLALIKKRSIPSINHRQVAGLLAVIAVVYTIITYIAGIWVGFSRNSGAFSGKNLLQVVLPTIAVIIATELIRRVLLAQESKVAAVLAYITGILADLAIGHSLVGITGVTQFMDVVGLTLFPAITSGLVFQHLSKRYGATPIILYRLLMVLPLSLLPLTPAIPEVITSFILNFLPFGIRFFIDLLYEKKPKYATRKAKKISYVGLITTFVCMTAVVMVISGQFKYKLLVIATPSMTGSLNVGDAVIYEEYDGNTVKEGDIVVFTKDDKTLTVHRVIDVQYLNGTIYYTTKGDANDTADSGYITQSNLRGVVQFKLSHLGHASLWLRDLFS